MSSLFPIIPQDRVTTQTVASFRVDVNNIVLFSSASLGIVLFDENNNFLSSFPMTISGDDYNNWGGNDEYIGILIAGKLGFTLTPEVVTEVVPEVVPEVTPEVVQDVVPEVIPETEVVTEEGPVFPDLFPATNESCY